MAKLYPNSYVVTFDPNDVLEEIFNSYGGNKNTNIGDFPYKLVNGFRVDFPRMKFSYNDCDITDMNTYHDIIYDYSHQDSSAIIPNLYVILLLLSTQASFFNSYSVIHSTFSNLEKNIYVTQTRDHPKISIHATTTEVRVYIKKSYQTINSETGTIYNIYHTCMLINFEYKNHVWSSSICMLYWLIELLQPKFVC